MLRWHLSLRLSPVCNTSIIQFSADIFHFTATNPQIIAFRWCIKHLWFASFVTPRFLCLTARCSLSALERLARQLMLHEPIFVSLILINRIISAQIQMPSYVWRAEFEEGRVSIGVKCGVKKETKSFNIEKSVVYVLYRAYCQFTDDIGWTIQFFERLLAFSQHFDNEWNGSMVLQSFAYKLLNYTVIADGITSGINILCAASVVFSSSSSSSSLPLLVVKLYARLFSP